MRHLFMRCRVRSHMVSYLVRYCLHIKGVVMDVFGIALWVLGLLDDVGISWDEYREWKEDAC